MGSQKNGPPGSRQVVVHWLLGADGRRVCHSQPLHYRKQALGDLHVQPEGSGWVLALQVLVVQNADGEAPSTDLGGRERGSGIPRGGMTFYWSSNREEIFW